MIKKISLINNLRFLKTHWKLKNPINKLFFKKQNKLIKIIIIIVLWMIIQKKKNY
jgi:hypothetical protein